MLSRQVLIMMFLIGYARMSALYKYDMANKSIMFSNKDRVVCVQIMTLCMG